MVFVYKVAIVGITGAGKTTYVYRLRNLPLHKVVRTRNVELHRIKLDDPEYSSTSIFIYDFPGHEEYKALVKSSFEALKISNLIIFIDLTRFQDSISYIQDLLNYVNRYVKDLTAVIVGNKADIAPPNSYENLAATCEELDGTCNAVFELSAIRDDIARLSEPIKALLAVAKPTLLP